MPPAITVSPRRVTPSRAYCTAQTSRSPKPSPSRAHVWPRRKNSNQNGLCNKFSYFTGFGRFRAGGEDGLEQRIPPGAQLVGAQLQEMVLEAAVLRNADCRGADLTRANLNH